MKTINEVNINEEDPFIIIDGVKGVNYKWVVSNLNIKSGRLDKWMKGRGQACLRPLRFIKIGPQSKLYNYEDIIYLKEKTEEYLKTSPKGGRRVDKK